MRAFSVTCSLEGFGKHSKSMLALWMSLIGACLCCFGPLIQMQLNQLQTLGLACCVMYRARVPIRFDTNASSFDTLQGAEVRGTHAN